jgi:hypothetical protein
MSDNYLGNPTLKKAGVKINFTEDQIREYHKCAKDPEYFIENYMKIVSVDRGLINFGLYQYQRKMVRTFKDNRFSICKMPRQSGKSTTVTGYMLWLILFHDNQSIAILANKGSLARDMLAKIQLAYEHIPKWMQQGIVIWNKGNIELENGSKILASATSASAIRGGSYNLIFLDEFAFVPRNIAEEFFASVYPTISSGKTSKIIVVSTPNGLNHYYKMWVDATEKRSEYVPIEVHWRDTPGRDDKWREQTIRNTSEEQFKQEFETEFLGSTLTLISGSKLRSMAFKNVSRDAWGVDIYHQPEFKHTYAIMVDTGHGVGLDYSAFTVVDVSQVPYRVVAKYRNNNVVSSFYPEIIARYARAYNNAYILVETNDIGKTVAETLHRDLECENVLWTTQMGRGGQQLSAGFSGRSQLGVTTSRFVKAVGCSSLKELIEGDKLIIEDFDIIEELSNFVSKGSSYEAEEGYNDDLVMSLVLFGWLAKQLYFKELTDIDIRHRIAEEKLREMDEDLLPAGFYDDGTMDDPMSLDGSSGEGEWLDRWSRV